MVPEVIPVKAGKGQTNMIGEILRIKTSIPPSGKDLLKRQHILEHLDAHLITHDQFHRKITMVSAPAGYGKTTLIRSWISGRESQTAWYSLDESDNEPERFWIHVLSALQHIHPDICKAPLEALRSQELTFQTDRGFEAILTPLLNDLFSIDHPWFLILDDFHHINHTEIHNQMIFFIENLPPSLHVAVTTRSDPPWPLSRWRAKHLLQEIRINDLKFSASETAHLFTRKDALPKLDETQLAVLCEKTEGWIAGIQLAAVSLKSVQNPNEFIRNFNGSSRHILHFLTEEIFSHQPPDVQDFLLKSSVFNQFCPSLCDAVMDRNDSSELISSLERNNVYIIPMDDCGIWYRYHQLFADLLRFQAAEQVPDTASQLHLRASEWFLQSDQPGEAVRHAAENRHYEKVAELLDVYHDKILFSDGPGLLNWCMEALPKNILNTYPRLVLYKALYCLNYSGKEDAREYLETARQLISADPPAAAFEAMYCVIQSFYGVYHYDFNHAESCRNRAELLLAPDDAPWRMRAAIYAGDAQLFSGNALGAYPLYLEAERQCRNVGSSFMGLTTQFKTAACLYYMGNILEAERLLSALISSAHEKGLSRLARVGLLWSLLGELHRVQGSLQEAERCIERALYIGYGERPSYGWNCLFKAALLYSRGQFDQAMQLIQEIESLDYEVHLPRFVTLPALVWKAKILIAQNQSAEAERILNQSGVSCSSDIPHGYEPAYLALAEARLAGSEDVSVPETLLGIIRSRAFQGGQAHLLLETLLAEARLHELSGRMEQAESALLLALEIGSENHIFQLFLDHAAKLIPVFTRVTAGSKNRINSTDIRVFTRRIADHLAPVSAADPAASEALSRTSIGLIEPLTVREIEILELVGQGLSNDDIGESLFISQGTVKWHISNIFGKLGVTKRTKAVAAARELKLIP